MAETNIKIIVLRMLEHFEFEYVPGAEGFSEEINLLPFYTLQSVTLRLRLRS